MIGHKGHPEVEGTMGQVSEGIYLVEDVADVARGAGAPTRTSWPWSPKPPCRWTMPPSIIGGDRRRFPNVREPKQQDICYATAEPPGCRQGHGAAGGRGALWWAAPPAPTATACASWPQRLGTPAYMVDYADDLQEAWFNAHPRVGLTAGASAPDVLVQQVIARLRALGAVGVRRMQA